MAIHEGDIGAVIRITVTTDGAVESIADATTKTIVVRAPNGTITTRPGVWVTDGSDAKMKWTTTATTDLVAGTHHIAVYMVRPTWRGYTSRGHFYVEPHLVP